MRTRTIRLTVPVAAVVLTLALSSPVLHAGERAAAPAPQPAASQPGAPPWGAAAPAPDAGGPPRLARSAVAAATRFVLVDDPAGGTPPAGPAGGADVRRLPEVVVRPPNGTGYAGVPGPGGVYRSRRTAFSEADRVGPNLQPEWTTQRRFATTRSYVLAPGQVELETWWKGKMSKGEKPDHLFQEEVGIGLPYRLQLDLYGNVAHGPGGPTIYEGTQVEVRWALAAWGRLPLNPTLYGEWKFNTHDAPDAWEAKLLLAQDVGCYWHLGANLFFERETSGELAEEMGVSVAAGRAILDQKLSLGVELQYERATVEGARSDPAQEVLLGPSLQWRPWRNTHLDVVPLFGLTGDAPDLEMYVIFGIDLGPGHQGGGFSPVSTRSR